MEENQKYYERHSDNIKALTHDNKKLCSYIGGRLYQATYNVENFKEMCLHDISLETYVTMLESTFKTLKYMLETMVEPVFGKDTSNYLYFEGKVHEVIDTLNLLKEIMKREKTTK